MAIAYNTSVERDGLVLHLDAANPKSFSPNVHPKPLDVYTWASAGGAYQMTLSKETSFTSPVGGQPLKIVTSGTAGYVGTYNSSTWNLAPAASGQTWTFSFWVKGSSSFTASSMIFGANSSGGYIELGQTYYNVTTDWTRVSGSYTLTNASAAYVQLRIDCYVNGVTMWVDGLQLERASSASSFSSITNTNGNSWYDLSGNSNNFTLYNFPTFANGAITFNGSNQYAKSTNTLNLSLYSSVVCDIAFKSDITTSSMILYEHSANWNTNIGAFGLAVHSNGTANYLNGFHSNHKGEVARNYEAVIGTDWSVHSNVFSKVDDSTGRLAYINGSLTPFTTLNGYATGTATAAGGSFIIDYMYIASRGGSSGWFNGKVSSVKIYSLKSPALSVLKNFNAVRDRYGI